MPYKKKTPILHLDYTNIVGAYFRNQRISDGISLVYVADSVHINKGYLSDLENGKRPFSLGLIHQLNDFYQTNFIESKEYYDFLQKSLYSAFNDLFNINELKEKEILDDVVLNKQEYEHSSGFFIYQIIKIFYYIRIQMDKKEFNASKKILEENLDAIEKKNLAILYCLLGIYYKRNTITNYLAEEYLNKVIPLISSQSKINALCIFEKITIFAETNRAALAYSYCEQARILFSQFNNYTTLFFIDLFQYNCLTLLGLFNEARTNLNTLLNNLTQTNEKYISTIYHNLAWNALLDNSYEECIQMSKKAIDLGNKSSALLYFIPYSFYKLKQTQNTLDCIEKYFESISDLYKPFLIALHARIQNNRMLFEKNILTFYTSLLEKHEYEDIIISLEIMIDYFSETNQKDKLISTYADYKMYKENKLTLKSSQLKRWRH